MPVQRRGGFETIMHPSATAAAATFHAVCCVQAREDYDVRVMQLTKQRREGVMKAKTGRGGVTRYEARLNSKKHRTTSRRQLKQNVWGDVNEDEQADGVF